MILGYWLGRAYHRLRQLFCRHRELVRTRSGHHYHVKCWRCGYSETYPTMSRRIVSRSHR